MLRTNAGVLAATLARVAPLIERRQSIPILSTARLRVEAGQLTASATNLDAQLDAVATVEHAGPSAEICVSPARLVPLLKLMPRLDTVELVIDGPDLVVSWNGGRATLSALPACDFPDLQLDDTAAGSAELDATARAALARVTPFISTEQTRYYLNGVCLADLEGRGVFVATDGHRLACMNGGETLDLLVAGFEGAKPIVPRRTVRLWLEMAERSPARVTFWGEKRWKIDVATEGLRLRSEVIDGVYPDFTRVIPKTLPDSLCLARQEVVRACRMVLAMAWTSDQYGSLVVENGRAQLQFRVVDRAESAVDIGPVLAADREFGIRLSYLLAAVQATRGDTITLAYGPTQFEPVCVLGSDRGDREAVLILPLRSSSGRAKFSAPAYEAAA